MKSNSMKGQGTGEDDAFTMVVIAVMIGIVAIAVILIPIALKAFGFTK